MRPAIELTRQIHTILSFDNEAEDEVVVLIEADRAELVAEIVAELRAIAAWNDKIDDGLSGLDKMAEGQRDAADHIETKFGGCDG